MSDVHVHLLQSEIESLSETADCAEAIVALLQSLPVVCKREYGCEPTAIMLRQIRESAEKLESLLRRTEHLLKARDVPQITMPLTGKSMTFVDAAWELAFDLGVRIPDASTEALEANRDATCEAIECFGDSYSPKFLERLERLIVAEAQGAKLRARAGYLPAAPLAEGSLNAYRNAQTEKAPKYSWGADGQAAADEFKRRFRDAMDNGDKLSLKEFCGDYSTENALSAGTLYNKLREHRKKWDPESKFGARPRRAQ